MVAYDGILDGNRDRCSKWRTFSGSVWLRPLVRPRSGGSHPARVFLVSVICGRIKHSTQNGTLDAESYMLANIVPCRIIHHPRIGVAL